MATIFTKIVNGEIPCYKIAEDERFFAFLDINPVQKGHTLVIPKVEEDYIFRLDDETVGDLMIFAKKVALAIEEVVACKRISVAVMGLEVPHTHIHLIPIQNEGDFNFANKKSISQEEMISIAEQISAKVRL
jgi:histidine triad (HIT) family protein